MDRAELMGQVDHNEETCTVRVLLFSVLRERVGAKALSVSMPGSATGSDLLDQLAREHPVIGEYREVTRLAVNQTYASEATPLSDGDEVALITPVSGG